jgi:hypothetical protein
MKDDKEREGGWGGCHQDAPTHHSHPLSKASIRPLKTRLKNNITFFFQKAEGLATTTYVPVERQIWKRGAAVQNVSSESSCEWEGPKGGREEAER